MVLITECEDSVLVDLVFGINLPAWGAKKAAAPTSSID